MASTYTPIATVTASGSTNSITFSSIPSTYTDLVIVKNGGNTATSNSTMIFNGDASSNYSDTAFYGDGSNGATFRDTNATKIVLDYFSTSGQRSATIINVMNYASTSTYKTGIFRRSDSFNAVLAMCFLWRSTSAINSITFGVISTGNFDSTTTFTLYGVKNA